MPGLAPERVVQRVLAKIDRNHPNGCWISLYAPHKKTGYCQVGWSDGGISQKDMVHRVVWKKFWGPIPDGFVVDHQCKNRRCVNLSHLRLLTRAQNSRDQANTHKTHCHRGHPLSGDNVYLNAGGKRGRPGRQCKTCKNLNRRTRYHEQHPNATYQPRSEHARS